MTIFITGTGTGIGKTMVSAILTEALDAAYWKPIQAGVDTGTDSAWVQEMTGRPAVAREAYLFRQAASPHIASRSENMHVDLDKIVNDMPRVSGHLIVEGAGGIMVPLNDHEFVIDLIPRLKAKTILVSRNTLGSINHSLLTAMACRQKGIDVIGWIFNDNYLDYEDEIVRWSGYPRLASIPFSKNPDRNFIAVQASIIKENSAQWL